MDYLLDLDCDEGFVLKVSVAGSTGKLVTIRVETGGATLAFDLRPHEALALGQALVPQET
jgi:hypothetical protein